LRGTLSPESALAGQVTVHDFEGVPEEPPDYLDRARTRALELALERGRDPDRVEKAFEDLANALGRSWLNHLPTQRVPDSPVDRFSHELGQALALAGVSEIAELLELAKYLAALHDVPGFADTCDVLKNDYSHGLLQLAWAYRFRRIGAEELVLEPDATDGRKGDISFTLAGQPFMVECYCPSWRADKVDASLKRLLGDKVRVALRSQPAVVAVAVGEPLGSGFAKYVEREVVRAIDELSEKELVRRGEVPHLDIAATSIRSDRDAPEDVIADLAGKHGEHRFEFRLVLMPRRDAEALWKQKKEGKLAGRVAIWLPQATPRLAGPEWWDDLIGKIEKKLPQTRKDGGAARGVVVGLRKRSDWSEPEEASRLHLNRRLLEGRKDMGFVFVLRREWTERGHYGYSGARFFGAPPAAPSEVQAAALTGVEMADLLADL
jgi:hypothetical protein